IIADPSLAFGEAYMHKQLEIEGNLQTVIESLYRNMGSFLRQGHLYNKALKKISNNLKKSRDNIEHHYDIGNDFYKLWLDDTMTYSCGYFKTDHDTLTQAQKNKIDLILRKLNLKEGQSLIDIGCGWGELILAAVKKYKVKALGITLSSEQFSAAEKRIKEEGLSDLAEVQLIDYREIKDRKFDRVVSVGMLEHVGKDHLHEYFSHVNQMLNDGGLSLLHSITGIHESEGGTNSWINKYIFPGGYIPSIQELVRHISEEDFHLIDMESLRRHYGRTLEHWADNFESALPEIQKNMEESFVRMWRLYLNSCAASFNSGNIDIHQFLFTKGINDDIPWCRNYMYR
ncbi:MAG TPA: cyclopropane-fatty-acyl-phospholipid synthase family protein, partial [Anaerovoracaceae bacterium]|nr:cyclopropane-fatty-acyl-phospholipid synthase family protein [Anaerovoracaceae bacterium]